MAYNPEGLQRLVGKLGLKVEVDRMLSTGIGYREIAVAFDKTFNPEKSDTHDRTSCEGLFPNELKAVNRDWPDERADGRIKKAKTHEIFQNYFGIGTYEDYGSYKFLSGTLKKAEHSVRQRVNSFDCFFKQWAHNIPEVLDEDDSFGNKKGDVVMRFNHKRTIRSKVQKRIYHHLLMNLE